MAISKTQCGWMALGGVLCMLSIGLVCHVRDNQVSAREEKSDTADVKEARVDNVPPTLALPGPVDSKPVTVPPPVEPKMKALDVTPTAPTLMPLGEPSKPLPPLKIDNKPVDDRPIPQVTEVKTVMPPPPTPIGISITPATVIKPTAINEDVSVQQPVVLTQPDRSGSVVPPPDTKAIGVGPLPLSSTAPPTPAPPAPSSIAIPAPPAPSSIAIGPITRVDMRTEGEPPLAPRPGPVQVYHVKHSGETPADIARKTLGSTDRCEDVIKLNPSLKSDTQLVEGTVIKLPADACIPTDEVETVKPLPILRKPAQVKVKAMPLTGTYPCNLDEKRSVALPRAIRDQLGNCDTVLVSPGPDHCVWVTNQAHLDRLGERLDQSPAREIEVRVFKRLYFAQTERVAVTAEGRVQISERLAQFAGLNGEVVLVGIDDHFELWDVTRWKSYTQQESQAVRQSGEESE